MLLSSSPISTASSDADLRSAAAATTELPPAIILGGETNALSVARDLSSMGVSVHAIGEHDSAVRNSRHVRWIEIDSHGDAETTWAEYLLSAASDHLRGAVLLTCGDAGLTILRKHRDELQKRFLLDLANPVAQEQLLDKLSTYRLAQAAGVTTPKFWSVQSAEQVRAVRDELVYPLLVKPRLSHLFDARFGKKFIIAHNFEQLIDAFDLSSGAGMAMLLVEMIPGGDEQLCSYFTYIDESGVPLFHYTKRIIRRYPVGMGAACHHVTDWIPELIAPANRLLDEAGLRGLANIEFKLDPRDGQYKLIECNARFVASNGLVSASGYSLAKLVYNRLTNRPLPKFGKYRTGLHQWDPFRDFLAYRQLKREGRLTFLQWIGSALHPQFFAYFKWDDPLPALVRLVKPLAKKMKLKRVKRP